MGSLDMGLSNGITADGAFTGLPYLYRPRGYYYRGIVHLRIK